MRPCTITAVFAALLVTSIASAQQPSGGAQKQAIQSNSLPPGPIIGGDGTANYVPLWRTNSYLQNSVLYQSGGNIGLGTTTPQVALDVYGSINAATNYSLGSRIILQTAPFGGLFLGPGAGNSNVRGQGQYNSFFGFEAGFSNTTGASNTFSGYQAGFSNTTGGGNAFYGNSAGLKNTIGLNGTFVGEYAGGNNVEGNDNTFIGTVAGLYNTSGSGNTFVGSGAGVSNLGNENTYSGTSSGNYASGDNNTYFGSHSGYNTAGSNNTFIGYHAGINTTSGSGDVYISNQGPATGSESNTIRIGDPSSQSATYIAGVYGSTPGSGIPVFVNSNGQLGTLTSSMRFKEEVRDMGNSTDALMSLRPVTFLYKPDYAGGERTLQYGLIAEEVAKIYPELVVYDKEGQPYSVRYQYLSTMLLNEVQKQYHRAESEAQVIRTQQQKIDALEQRLNRIERLMGTQADNGSEQVGAQDKATGGAE